MQAATPVDAGMPPVTRATAIPSVTDALRAVESVLMRGGQRTARRNAWTSVLEDRRRAKDRVEAQHVLEGVATRASEAT
ncbi:SCO2195 family GlnR-regulated protein [Streptomyces hypolithicus]